MRLSGAILAGGRSTRMGFDKARLELRGEPVAARLARRLRRVCGDVLLVGDGAPELPGCRTVQDAHEARSSLTGLYTALRAATEPLVLVVACDYPFVPVRLLELLARAWHPGLHSVVPLSSEGLQPLVALHHRDLAPRLRERLDAGRFRVTPALDPARTAVLPWASLRRLGFRPEGFWNLNTPEDLQRALQHVEELDGYEDQDGRADDQ